MPSKAIDRKYKVTAVSVNSGKTYTEKDVMVFKASDPALPATLKAYEETCREMGVSEAQQQGVRLLRERVEDYQRTYPKKVKFADVAPGKEAKRVCAPNF